MNPSGANLGGAIILRGIFFLVMIFLAILHVGYIFKGINTREGMEQAAIAREVSRGNGLITKVIYPAAIKDNQQETNGTGTLADVATNTYHAPLNPLLLGAVFRAVGADDFQRWKMRPNEYVYALDRVVATFSVVCYLLSIGVIYLLASRMFDPKIASTTAILMLFCELFWTLSLSGLPQMLMLLLFSSGCLFAYRSCEAEQEERSALIDVILASLFFTLLALTHWLAVWIAVGYALAAALFIKPRGISGLILIFTLALAAIFPVLQNMQVTGTPGGTAFLAIYEGLSFSEEYALRNLDELTGLNLRGLVLQLLQLSVTQLQDLFGYLGSILAAPVFFLALMHPFKKKPLATFRWILAIMWVFAAFGMGLFGLTEGIEDSNQMHILFAPIMAAYGTAFISILWARIEIPSELFFLRNAHLIILVAISASPILLKLPKETVDLLEAEKLEAPHFPPYAPSLLNGNIADFVEENEILASDQPWAVAWYADRRSLWLPFAPKQLEEIEKLADSEKTPIVGVYMTPISGQTSPLIENGSLYNNYLALVIDSWASTIYGAPAKGIISNTDPRLKRFKNRYPFETPLTFRRFPIILHSSRRFGS